MDSQRIPASVCWLHRMKFSGTIFALVMLSAAAIPAQAARGHRGGFSPGSGFHRPVIAIQHPQHKPAKDSKPAPHPKTAQRH